jgi:5-oxoprolinase (ATP-hydrolysing)
MLIDSISTIVVEPSCTAHITSTQDVRIELERRRPAAGTEEAEEAVECDPIQLAIFSHRW